LGEKPNAETEQLASAAGAGTATAEAAGGGITLPAPSVGVSVNVPLETGTRANVRDCLKCAKPRAFNRDTDRFTGACPNCAQSEKGANNELADMISGRHPKLTNDPATATASYD
jgi:hypothetical protein